jgi:hypothetical protein
LKQEYRAQQETLSVQIWKVQVELRVFRTHVGQTRLEMKQAPKHYPLSLRTVLVSQIEMGQMP